MELYIIIPVGLCLVIALSFTWFLNRGLQQRTDAHAERLEQLEGKLHVHSETMAALSQRIKKLRLDLDKLIKVQADHYTGLQSFHDEFREFSEAFTTLSNKVKMLSVPIDEVAAVRGVSNLGSPMVKEVTDKLEQGESIMEIARQTGLQVGEIHLIRGLKQLNKEG